MRMLFRSRCQSVTSGLLSVLEFQFSTADLDAGQKISNFKHPARTRVESSLCEKFFLLHMAERKKVNPQRGAEQVTNASIDIVFHDDRRAMVN